MENFSELIKNRRSMRKFTDEELTQDQVVALMKAALMSPSSKRSNSWQFVVVDDKEVLKELSHCKEQASSFIADAALAIVVMADPLASDVWIEDASIASIMIQLQAEDLGFELLQLLTSGDVTDVLFYGTVQILGGLALCAIGMWIAKLVCA